MYLQSFQGNRRINQCRPQFSRNMPECSLNDMRITLGREMQILTGNKAANRCKRWCAFLAKNKKKEADIYWLTICSFYFRRDFVCRYCAGPLNEDVTCRILAGNIKPNTVYRILLLGSITNKTSKIYNKETCAWIQFSCYLFQISVSYSSYVPWRLTRGYGSKATVAFTKPFLCTLEVRKKSSHSIASPT